MTRHTASKLESSPNMRVCEQLVAHAISQDGQNVCQIREGTLSKKDMCSICDSRSEILRSEKKVPRFATGIYAAVRGTRD